jgi:hypothetical protein
MQMRRLIMSFSLEDLDGFEPWLSQNIESLEVLHFLRQDQNEIALICRVTPKNPTLNTDPFPARGFDQVQLLDRTSDGICTYFVKTKPRSSFNNALLKGLGGYLMEPLEVTDGKVKMTFLGNPTQARRFLRRMDKTGVPYKLISLEDARFSPDSPLNRLTEKQRRVLITAYKLGYYNLPKTMNAREVAEKLGMRNSTFSIHRIKAERRLIAAVIAE